MKPSFPAWFALILLFTPCLTQAQNAPPPPAETSPDKQGDYNKIIDHFFVALKAGKYTDAAHILIDTNPQDEFNVEKHESLAVPLEKIVDTFGAFKEFKPLVTKTLGDGVGYVYGLAIYEKSPIRFEFIFYKDGASWRLLHIDFNLNYIPELRELAGVHIPLTPVYTTTPAIPAPAVQPKTPDTAEPPVKPVTPPVPPASSTSPAPSTPPATPPASSPSTAPARAPSPAP